MTALQQIGHRLPTSWSAGYGVLAGLLVALLLALFSVIKLELVVNGLFLGAIIALGAIGLSLVYGTLKFTHIAHGDFMTLGAYIALFFLATLFPRIGIQGEGLGPFTFGYPLLLALPLTMAALVGVAIALDVGIYRRLRRRGSGIMAQAIASLGVAIALRGMVQLIWGGEEQQYPQLSQPSYQLPLDVRIPPDSLFIGALALALVLALSLFLTRTKMGKAMRAASGNLEVAQASGISTEHVIWWT